MSQVSKLNSVNNRLGATMPGQQTTRYIFDTVTAAAAQTNYDFFQTFSGKSAIESNLNVNKLDSSESMVIKSIFIATNSSTVDLLGHMNLNITVGNQVVLKDFNPAFSTGGRGTAFARIISTVTDAKALEIRLLTDIVIPPQVNFKAELELAENTAAAGDKVRFGLKGYGVIFSAGSTF
jgi:hypothetical protein